MRIDVVRPILDIVFSDDPFMPNPASPDNVPMVQKSGCKSSAAFV
jgi:hypothetical protein